MKEGDLITNEKGSNGWVGRIISVYKHHRTDEKLVDVVTVESGKSGTPKGARIEFLQAVNFKVVNYPLHKPDSPLCKILGVHNNG